MKSMRGCRPVGGRPRAEMMKSDEVAMLPTRATSGRSPRGGDGSGWSPSNGDLRWIRFVHGARPAVDERGRRRAAARRRLQPAWDLSAPSHSQVPRHRATR